MCRPFTHIPALYGGICDPRHVTAALGEDLCLGVIHLHYGEGHVPVLSVPHQGREGPERGGNEENIFKKNQEKSHIGPEGPDRGGIEKKYKKSRKVTHRGGSDLKGR